MLDKNPFRSMRPASVILALTALIAVWILLINGPDTSEWSSASRAAMLRATGSPQLISVQALPGMAGEMCEWMPAGASASMVAALQQERLAKSAALPSSADSAGETRSVNVDRKPVRVLRDTYPTYSAIAIDLNSNEVYLQDENLFGVKVFDRMANTPPAADFTEPKRIIEGAMTKLEFNCGLYVDPRTGDLYSVANDTTDALVIFPRDAKGNMKPMRELHTPHGTYGISVDEETQEMYLTVQNDSTVVVYRKMAEGEEKPLRKLEGDHTGLADPHGVAVDVKNGWMFVSNHGHSKNSRQVGHFEFPSITVYPLEANGDVQPIRVIAGPKTQLDWPAHLFVDSARGELYVANDSGDSILVFRTNDSGDVAPVRVLSGPRTQIKNPTGVFVDLQNEELWVSNMGNHRATVYSRAANGNAAPKRVIRSAPEGKLAMAIGNPGAVGYDSKRGELLVPNCVAHPQIAMFSRMAKENSQPTRTLAGQKTLLSRTMHDVRYDPVHDEIVVANPFAQAILVFRGGASGEEAPMRVIQGPHTELGGSTLQGGVERLEIDPLHNEIIVPAGDRVLVYPLSGDGDVPPIRVIQGPETKLRKVRSTAVDPISDRIALGTNLQYQGEFGSLLVFKRTDDGNAKPQGIIMGPKSGIISITQMQVYPPKGWIVATMPGDSYDAMNSKGIFVGAWSIYDNGDVPPRWKLSGPNSVMQKPRGLALNARNKEIIVADMRLNAVLTYYFPEIF